MKLQLFATANRSGPKLPLSGAPICAGFPSPAEEYLEATLDLSQVVLKNPSSTFFGRVKGRSMRDAGVDSGDLLVIDKSLPYRQGALAVCFINGEFTLKRIKLKGEETWLVPANSEFEPIVLRAEDEFAVWGIVTYILKKVY